MNGGMQQQEQLLAEQLLAQEQQLPVNTVQENVLIEGGENIQTGLQDDDKMVEEKISEN